MTARMRKPARTRRAATAPLIDHRCEGCGTCIEVCERNVLELDAEEGKVTVVRAEDCSIYCERCAANCPNDAIRLPGHIRRAPAGGRSATRGRRKHGPKEK